MTHAKLHFNRLMLTLSFGIRTSEPPRAWQMTEKAGPDSINSCSSKQNSLVMDLLRKVYLTHQEMLKFIKGKRQDSLSPNI